MVARLTWQCQPLKNNVDQPELKYNVSETFAPFNKNGTDMFCPFSFLILCLFSSAYFYQMNVCVGTESINTAIYYLYLFT